MLEMDSYKYLEMLQAREIEHKKIKEDDATVKPDTKDCFQIQLYKYINKCRRSTGNKLFLWIDKMDQHRYGQLNKLTREKLIEYRTGAFDYTSLDQ